MNHWAYTYKRFITTIEIFKKQNEEYFEVLEAADQITSIQLAIQFETNYYPGWKARCSE